MTNKIPFDIEKWKSGKYDVVTRGDNKVHSLYLHDVAIEQPISFYCYESDGLECCSLKGEFWRDGSKSGCDLFLIPKKRKVWIAVNPYSSDDHYGTSCAYLSKETLLERFDYMKNWHIIEVELPDENT